MAAKLEMILLGVLLRKPSTGYDLKKFMDSHGRFMRSNTQMSQVYASLGKMEDRGWVDHAVEPRAGAQDAKLYSVTPEGETVFLDWLTGPYAITSRFQDSDLFTRLSFAGFMSTDDVLRLLDAEIEARQAQVARYRNRDRSTPVATSLPFDAELSDLVAEWSHRTGAAAVDAHIAACIELRRELAARTAHTQGATR
ncbi:PadR family transcriptional regulator [Phytoactinopolyspora halotolerans]|uniref:PadR family transcriptional regulator n=1 Tax=Phytoactinopolyspora halotolerans TaxID=1981512 RepID=UPI001C2029EB|nr:PadR family transcriptional regulator [Phytoactinopolyspora halotolerans]